MRYLPRFLVIASISALSSQAVSAATLEGIQGDVSLNRGTGFQKIVAVPVLQVGDVIMAAPNAKATIVYSENCRLHVTPGVVVSVQAKPPCVQGAHVETGGSLKDGPAPITADARPPLGAWLAGNSALATGAAIIAGGTLIYIATNPSSP